VARQLAKLPQGTRVQLHYGAVWIRYARKWMLAGTIGDPITSAELSRLNGGVLPVQLSPAWEPVEVAP
jgi:hypothetical protein